jgi:hypothetical protein
VEVLRKVGMVDPTELKKASEAEFDELVSVLVEQHGLLPWDKLLLNRYRKGG